MKGLRNIPQRYWVVTALKKDTKATDATQLWGYLKSIGYKISLTSAYSSLDVLLKAGLVLRTLSSSKKYVYQIK
ncbi:transcriptional repressor [Flavivirga sp. 57AJ16]|uniref:transcriptional repressor n=1 Tax=Flavivirga sp. 57AJ16 TaxID=3025307 RepID=UPI0034DE7CA9